MRILRFGQFRGHRCGCLSGAPVRTERPLRTGHPYASDATVDDIQVVDVMETASNLHQLMSRCDGVSVGTATEKNDFAPTSTLGHRDCSRGVEQGSLYQSIRKHRRRGTCCWRRCQEKGRCSREIGCCRREHGGRISTSERSMRCQTMRWMFSCTLRVEALPCESAA